MTRNDETLVLVAVGLYLLNRYSFDVVPALQQGGVRAYEALHDDKEHQQDLPRPERMQRLPPVVQARLKKLVQLASEAGFPNPELAAAIAMAESGGRADSIARTARELSVGLWQVNVKAHPQYTEQFLLDPVNNARAAYALSKQGKDWRPWSAYKNGSYKRYLP